MSNTLSVTDTVSEPDPRRWLMLPVVLGLTVLLPRRAAGREPAIAGAPAAREPAEHSAGAAR